MLPAAYRAGRHLADVLPSCLAALEGKNNTLGLPEVSRTVVLLVDGLGANALRARAGHARFLDRRMPKAAVIESGFPTTTASAIASLTTGVGPGEHGLVGYTVRDIAHDRVVNQLKDWDEGMVPAQWQRAETVFERAGAIGIPAFCVGPARFVASGFTRAVLRGARYLSGESLVDRFAAARGALDANERSLVYVYVPELDTIAHAKGWQSDAWLVALEELDSAVARFASTLRAAEGMLVTSDHGILDVPHTAHVLFDTVDGLSEAVRHTGGEPRCLQLYLAADATAASRGELAEAWRHAEGERAWVATREEACAAGWFGPRVRSEVLPRIGDVVVAARSRVAYYDSRAKSAPRRMIGQHGSFSADELRVPLIALGAFD